MKIKEVIMADISRIKEHMKVISADLRLVGTVDCVKGEKIILTKSDPTSGGKHHWIPPEWVTSIHDEEVRLDQTLEQAQANWFDAENGEGHSGKGAVCP